MDCNTPSITMHGCTPELMLFIKTFIDNKIKFSYTLPWLPGTFECSILNLHLCNILYVILLYVRIIVLFLVSYNY